MSLSSAINPISTVRESKVIANQETIANQTQIITPTNGKFKRTVYHTPAIIQTVVDTPEDPPLAFVRPSTEYQSRLPIRRFDSGISPRVVTRPTTSIMQHRRYSTATREDNYDRGIGVKVNQDLSTFRPSMIPRIQQSREPKQLGFCQRLFGYCFGHRCPFWLCLLIPVLILLLLFFISYFINRHRIFYGYDTTSLDQNRLGYNASYNNLNDQLNTNTGLNTNGVEYNSSYQQNTLNAHPVDNTHPVDSRPVDDHHPVDQHPTDNLNRQPEIVSPLVSTDHPRSYEQNTTYTQQNANQNVNNLANFNNHPVQPTVSTGTQLNNGEDIYNRVRALQRGNYQRTEHNQTTTTTDDLVNQNPGISNLNQSNQGLQTRIDTSTTSQNGIRLAPTIEEVRTREMIDSERAAGNHETHKLHGHNHHLRHLIQ